MLKFFRTIRKKLIGHPSKGRTGDNVRKYLLYAIGEILLVLIGKICPVRDCLSAETMTLMHSFASFLVNHKNYKYSGSESSVYICKYN